MKIKVAVYLEGYECGEVEVNIPKSLYERIDWEFLRQETNFREVVKERYPKLAVCIDDAVTDAMYNDKLVDLDAVADMCGQTFLSHSGTVTFDYRNVEDYVARVPRKYYLVSNEEKLAVNE